MCLLSDNIHITVTNISHSATFWKQEAGCPCSDLFENVHTASGTKFDHSHMQSPTSAIAMLFNVFSSQSIHLNSYLWCAQRITQQHWLENNWFYSWVQIRQISNSVFMINGSRSKQIHTKVLLSLTSQSMVWFLPHNHSLLYTFVSKEGRGEKKGNYKTK